MTRFDYVSNDAALLNIQRYCLQEGRAAGVQMIRVANAAGLELHLAADRALDIAELRYLGTSIGYLSATGITHPAYYEPEGYGWLRSFYGGFLTTCGLDQVGEPCAFHDESRGLHGRISNCPAEQLCTTTQRDGQTLSGIVQGTTRQARQQGEAYLLRRTYHFSADRADFSFTDVIENQSATPLPLQLLYHFNLGHPFLSPELKIQLPPATIQPFSAADAAHCNEFADCTDPRELTLLHQLEHRAPDTTLTAENHGLRLTLQFDSTQLPILAQWRHLAARDYVLAFEPTNTHLQGVAWDAAQQTLEYLAPGQSKTLHFTVSLCKVP